MGMFDRDLAGHYLRLTNKTRTSVVALGRCVWLLPLGAADGSSQHSTRRAAHGNASWSQLQGKAPVGDWELALPNTPATQSLFTDKRITDILLVITYSGLAPAWPPS
jgi:hypothetical protein